VKSTSQQNGLDWRGSCRSTFTIERGRRESVFEERKF
jgi:hypothetical protein